MIHYHGTPLTPRSELLRCAGRHFLVSFADSRDDDICMQIGQSVLWDNGAFTAFRLKQEFDERELFDWLEPRMVHPHRAIILDVINGDEELNRAALKRWPFSRDLSWPVWHMDKSFDYLAELADRYPAVCIGSAKQYWQIGSPRWSNRMDETFNFLARRGRLPWLHGLRMLDLGNGRWPLASVDSSNVARSFNRNGVEPARMMADIDAKQPPARWHITELQGEMFECS